MDEVSDIEFHFSRDNKTKFQSTLERIRDENKIRTAFVVQYHFNGDKATATVPGNAVSQFNDAQLKELYGIK